MNHRKVAVLGLVFVGVLVLLLVWGKDNPDDETIFKSPQPQENYAHVDAMVKDVDVNVDVDVGEQRPDRVWISMGLCYSKNTPLYDKNKYPYVTITPLSVLLWKHFVPNVEVIVQIVYTEPDITDLMREYAATVVAAGAIVRWVKTVNDEMDCVLKAQLIRCFAFTQPEVQPNDTVVSVDVNAFPMIEEVLKPLYDNPHMRVWAFQWEDTAHHPNGTGEPFTQNLMVLRARDWRMALEYREDEPMVDWMQRKVSEFGLSEKSSWYYDQWVTTLSLLKHRLCSVPVYSGLWLNPGVWFDPGFDDSDVCFHGFGYGDCNRDIHIVYQGCKWWHFFPDQTFQEHLDKFHELTGNKYVLQLKSPFDR